MMKKNGVCAVDDKITERTNVRRKRRFIVAISQANKITLTSYTSAAGMTP
jgi:hypothetical protein